MSSAFLLNREEKRGREREERREKRETITPCCLTFSRLKKLNISLIYPHTCFSLSSGSRPRCSIRRWRRDSATTAGEGRTCQRSGRSGRPDSASPSDGLDAARAPQGSGTGQPDPDAPSGCDKRYHISRFTRNSTRTLGGTQRADHTGIRRRRAPVQARGGDR